MNVPIRSLARFHRIPLRVLATALLAALACSPRYIIPHDGRYDSQMPALTAASRQVFDRLLSASVKVTWTPEYRTVHYHHDLDRYGQPYSDPSSPTGFRLLRGEAGSSTTRDSYSLVGTGLLIARRATGTGLDAGIVLTAAHVVNAPDTVRAYLWDAKGQPTGALASISVKVSDFVFITGRGGANAGASVRKLDLEHDLAMLTTSIPVGNRTLSDFDFRIGSASDLDWGNFVYLIGYPHGQAQLTWGLVSRGDGEEEFMAGATINFGYSGGPVLAVRDDLPNLELVGICRGASTNKLRYLAPSDLLEEGVTMTPHLLGQTTVRETRQIEYGTAFVIPVERIRSFVLDGRDIFTEKGIDVFSHPPLRTWGF